MCEPRQVCTAATWTGLATSLMSKIRTPWNRVPTVGLVPQSTRARDSSTDMNSRFPWTDMSPWPPGHTTFVTFAGAAGSETS